jgi:hypothetical protein
VWGHNGDKQVIWQVSATDISVHEDKTVAIDFGAHLVVYANGELRLSGLSDCPLALHSNGELIKSPHQPNIVRSALTCAKLAHLTKSHLILPESSEPSDATEILPTQTHLVLKNKDKIWI